MELDIITNRKARKWSSKELMGRILWAAATPLFRLSPRPCWSWRSFMLRCFGGKVGKNVQIAPSAKITIPWNLIIDDWSSIGFDALIYNLGPLTIGRNVTISQRSHLCGGTHNYEDPSMPLSKMPITVADNAWICADAFVGPGVTIGEGAVVGARAVAIRDIPSWTVVAGNPASTVKQRVVNRPQAS